MLGIFISSGVFAEQNIKAIAMKKIKLPVLELQKICSSIKIQCSGQYEHDIGLWQLKNSQNQQYYLIDDRPQIVKLNKVGQSYIMLDRWDFQNYQHHNTVPYEDDLANNGLTIYPAFYPVNAKDKSIAIVNNWFTGYSGGGASEQNADFVVLKPKGKYQVALTDIPFSFSRMIRACFSEQDYKRSSHCHDEEWRVMSIRFKDIGQPYYQWTLNYSYYKWDAFKPESSTRVEKNSSVVIPFSQK